MGGRKRSAMFSGRRDSVDVPWNSSSLSWCSGKSGEITACGKHYRIVQFFSFKCISESGE